MRICKKKGLSWRSGFNLLTPVVPSGSKNDVTNANGAKKSGDVTVRVDGVVVGDANENESLTALGRDKLQNDRVSRMLLLQR